MSRKVVCLFLRISTSAISDFKWDYSKRNKNKRQLRYLHCSTDEHFTDSSATHLSVTYNDSFKVIIKAWEPVNFMQVGDQRFLRTAGWKFLRATIKRNVVRVSINVINVIIGKSLESSSIETSPSLHRRCSPFPVH